MTKGNYLVFICSDHQLKKKKSFVTAWFCVVYICMSLHIHRS